MDEQKTIASLWKDGKVGATTTTAPAPTAVPFRDSPEEKNARVAPATTTVFEDNYAPENIKELRAADDLRKLWDPQKTYASAITADDFAEVEITPGVLATEHQREQAARRYREILSDIGLSPEEA